jgi:hypothetical protein
VSETLLAIAIPCHVNVMPPMAQSLARLCGHLGATNVPFGIRFFGNAVSTFGRNELVKWASDLNASHILWIDTDMVFPKDSANRLLKHARPFIGCNYARKNALRDSSVSDTTGNRLIARSEGVEEVGTIGCGLTLVAMEVMEAVGEPWYKIDEDSSEGPGDEVRFCEIARKNGFPPFVDHALSRLCGHIGLTEFILRVA